VLDTEKNEAIRLLGPERFRNAVFAERSIGGNGPRETSA